MDVTGGFDPDHRVCVWGRSRRRKKMLDRLSEGEYLVNRAIPQGCVHQRRGSFHVQSVYILQRIYRDDPVVMVFAYGLHGWWQVGNENRILDRTKKPPPVTSPQGASTFLGHRAHLTFAVTVSLKTEYVVSC